MSNVVLQPCANSAAQRHYEDTVSVPVPLAEFTQHLPDRDLEALRGVSEDDGVRLWGAKPGEDRRNEARWKRVSAGDYLLFVHGRDRASVAEVAYTFHSEDLAKVLWGTALTANGVVQTWEYMFALGRPEELTLPTSKLNALIGRKPNAAVQEFVVLGPDPSAAVVEFLGLPSSPTISGEVTLPSIHEASSKHYGEVPGCPVGTVYKSRRDAYDAGVHRTIQAGIAGQSDGTQSICLSDGYSDDEIQGDLITYTGFGGRDPNTGRHIADQKLERGNLGLVENYKLGRPVRVLVRKSVLTGSSRDSGYIYLGLFTVISWSWGIRDNYKVLVYQLRAVAAESIEPQDVADALTRGDDVPTQRRSSTVNRIVRNYDVAASVKRLYENVCQICDTRLMTAAGPYSQGAHIRPLGAPHDGADTLGNILCLCPNCNVLFDGHALTVQPDGSILNLGQPNGTLTVHPAHDLNHDDLAYHLAISTDHSDQLAADGAQSGFVPAEDDMESHEVRRWMKRHCPEAIIGETDSERMASVLVALLQGKDSSVTMESEEYVPPYRAPRSRPQPRPLFPGEPAIFYEEPIVAYSMPRLSQRTRCYVRFPKRAASDLVGYAGLAWEIFNLLQGEPLDFIGSTIAVTAGALERIRFLDRDELKIVAFMVIRDRESVDGISLQELEEHCAPEADRPPLAETLAKLVKRGVLDAGSDRYSLAS